MGKLEKFDIDLSSLTKYVEERESELIKEITLRGKTMDVINAQLGVKNATALNILTNQLSIQDGAACGFEAQGDTAITQRVIEAVPLKVNQMWCQNIFEDYYMNYMTRTAAGQERLPYEQMIADLIVDQVKEANETMIWQGLAINGGQCNGLLSVMTNAGILPTNYSDEFTAVQSMAVAMPIKAKQSDEAVIFCGLDSYDIYLQYLVQNNLYHFNPNDGLVDNEIFVPGSRVKLIAVNGLNGTGIFVGGRKSNFYFGTDLMSDEETFKIWFSQDDDVFKLKIRYRLGTQIAFPDEVIAGSVAQTDSKKVYTEIVSPDQTLTFNSFWDETGTTQYSATTIDGYNTLVDGIPGVKYIARFKDGSNNNVDLIFRPTYFNARIDLIDDSYTIL